MLLIIWIVLGIAVGLIPSKIVSTTGEGTCRHPAGIVGAVIGGRLFDLFDGSRLTGFNLERLQCRHSRDRCDHRSGAVSRLLPPPYVVIFGTRFPLREHVLRNSHVAFIRHSVNLRAVGRRVAEMLWPFRRLS